MDDREERRIGLRQRAAQVEQERRVEGCWLVVTTRHEDPDGPAGQTRVPDGGRDRGRKTRFVHGQEAMATLFNDGWLATWTRTMRHSSD
jgi:hypothetical protein